MKSKQSYRFIDPGTEKVVRTDEYTIKGYEKQESTHWLPVGNKFPDTFSFYKGLVFRRKINDNT